MSIVDCEKVVNQTMSLNCVVSLFKKIYSNVYFVWVVTLSSCVLLEMFCYENGSVPLKCVTGQFYMSLC